MSEKMDSNYVDASTLDSVDSNPTPAPSVQPSFDSGLNYGAPMESAPLPQQPTYVSPTQPELEEPVGIGSWVGMLLLGLIPCVNIIMLFVWAFSGSFKKSQSNYAKAELIVVGIIIVLYAVLVALFVASGAADSLSYFF